MIDLIVFSIGSNRYAMKIEHIQRIIQTSDLTDIPNAHNFVDGMMSYEESVIKVLNFRKLINLETYDEELKNLFLKLKNDHKDWIKELEYSVLNNVDFSKTLNPHKCELGIWIDNFNSYDEGISKVLKQLSQVHKLLHVLGADILELRKSDKDKALEMIKKDIDALYIKNITYIDAFMSDLSMVSNSLQKLIIYENNSSCFAIKVDSIEDIAHIEEKQIMSGDNKENISEFLELEGVLDIDGVLINIIKSVKIPN